MRPFLAILLLSSIPLSRLWSQVANDTLSLTFDEIVISDNRMDLPFSQVSRTIHILRGEELRSMPIVHVSEALNMIPGLDVRQRGPHGVQGDLSIRGGTFEQSLVLVNGVRLSDPQTGHHQLNIPVDLSQIERIEVLKGPAARIYGQNAFAGAVNIVTRRNTTPFLELEAQAGSWQLGGLRLSAGLPTGGVSHRFSYSRDFSQGYRHNTDYDISHLFYQADAVLAGGQVQVMAGHTERAFGANGFYASPAFTEQFEQVQTSLFTIEYRRPAGNWMLKHRLFWRRNQDEYIFNRSNPSLYRNLHLGNVAGAELHASHTNKLGITGLGAEVSGVWLSSNNLGTHKRQVLSAFAEHRFAWLDERLDITPGLSVQYFSDFGARVFPGIDAGWHLSRYWKVYANTGLTYRVPTFTDLYYEDAANAGNPDLQPESAFSWELGSSFRRGAWHAQLAWFERRGQDLIDWVRASENDRWQPRNFQKLDMRGLEWSLDYFPGHRGLLKSLRLGYTLLEADVLTPEQLLSRYALNHLRHQVMAGVHLQWQSMGLHVQSRYSERMFLEDFLLLDARLSWQQGGLFLYVEGANLLQQSWTGPNLVPMPGRWLRTGLRYRWE
jgi:vitamin B12 transporter